MTAKRFKLYYRHHPPIEVVAGSALAAQRMGRKHYGARNDWQVTVQNLADPLAGCDGPPTKSRHGEIAP